MNRRKELFPDYTVRKPPRPIYLIFAENGYPRSWDDLIEQELWDCRYWMKGPMAIAKLSTWQKAGTLDLDDKPRLAGELDPLTDPFAYPQSDLIDFATARTAKLLCWAEENHTDLAVPGLGLLSEMIRSDPLEEIGQEVLQATATTLAETVLQDADREARLEGNDHQRRSRSPFERERERPMQRPRSPPFRRSPPAGPRGGYNNRARSRSADRRDDRVPTGPSAASWRRPRSPSPPLSGRTSGNTSRRSSPPVHPDRQHLTHNPIRDNRPRSPPTRERSPAIQLAYRDRESARLTPRERSPVRHVAARSPPRGPAAGFRAPPTGPSGTRNFTAPVSSISNQHSSPYNSTPVIPPAGPRGYVAAARGSYSMRGGRGSFSSDRPTRPDSTPWGAAPPQRRTPDIAAPRTTTPTTRPTQTPPPVITASPSVPPTIPTGPVAGIPTGPRAGVPSRPNLQHSSSIYNRNTSISAPSTGPRPHPALNNMPQIIPGGRIDPTATGFTPEISAHLKKLEEEEEILRAKLYAKQDRLNQSMREWKRLSRESAACSLRTQFSEQHLRQLAGESVGGAAF
ncbi:serine/arginine repetitive matrix protein 1 [Drepanopeziza brunnea f. sp. 'multigermtubi' MB_m1]|uniref:Serine/arginine repetitive matrix protein 1 n=1 Tax=Marssonina brunnea f. sp. multigermtubi (strain MB_m1) TaxID=1072389 RepID=K1WFJ8_MARBU|nr:serine/arginine repetitive matrix protein 1 [Drepanopeziza brunnea f. sp. 'multigermtubi' MB_m1]EKD16215.1 serine/arginine repetitive matrix protein 1 [Drepanopeziza brunnea f. sp. 'multigermtubi' MB_m1]